MPNGNYVLIPFVMAVMAFVLNFRILASCDMVMTKWSIDCSLSNSQSCVYVANIGMGFLAKQEIVNNPNSESDAGEMMKICQWYSNQDRGWLWDKFWNVSFYSFIGCTVLGAVTCALLGMSSCHTYKKKQSKMLSYLFGNLAILNTIPFLIYWKSKVCSKKGGVCDPSLTNCVDTCQMGSGSWQLFACSFIWISAMMTTWSIEPVKPSTEEKDDASQSTDDEDEEEMDDKAFAGQVRRGASELSVAYGHDEVVVIPHVQNCRNMSEAKS